MTDFTQQIRQQLTGSPLWGGPEAVHPHDGLSQALRRAGAQRPLMVAATFALLTDSNLQVRTGIVAVLREVISDIGVDKVVEQLQNNEVLFRGIAPAWRIEHDDLEQVAALAVAAGLKANDTAALGYLRRIAQNRSWGFYLLETLARQDTDWLIAHAKGLVPHDHLGVLGALPPGKQEQLIDSLAPYPPEKPSFFTKAFWNQLPSEDAARLRHRMWPEAQ